jgi:hypothetical protein
MIAIATLVPRGVVVVVSAGNNNLDAGSHTPARIPMASPNFI